MADDELETAAEILQHFSKHWKKTNGDRKAQQQLLQLIVARVWVKDDSFVALSLGSPASCVKPGSVANHRQLIERGQLHCVGRDAVPCAIAVVHSGN